MSNELAIKSAVSHEDRVHQVFQWIIGGASEREIEQAAAKEWPDVKCRPLIVTAMKGIAKSARPDPEAVEGWGFEALRVVYQRALEAGDFSAALRAIKQIVELSRKGRN
jgi:hypothetical protein